MSYIYYNPDFCKLCLTLFFFFKIRCTSAIYTKLQNFLDFFRRQKFLFLIHSEKIFWFTMSKISRTPKFLQVGIHITCIKDFDNILVQKYENLLQGDFLGSWTFYSLSRFSLLKNRGTEDNMKVRSNFFL